MDMSFGNIMEIAKLLIISSFSLIIENNEFICILSCLVVFKYFILVFCSVNKYYLLKIWIDL